jgi:hypothetical protein
VAAVEQAAPLTLGQEGPDRVVVLVGVRVVAVVPVHPVAEALALLGLDGGEPVDALLAQLTKRSIPNSSIWRLLLKPSSRSTSTSIHSPWQSKPFW